MIDEELYNKRRFSRVISCDDQPSSPMGSMTLRKRALSFGRQVSKSSRCTFGESTATVAGDVSECVVYVSVYHSVFMIQFKMFLAYTCYHEIYDS